MLCYIMALNLDLDLTVYYIIYATVRPPLPISKKEKASTVIIKTLVTLLRTSRYSIVYTTIQYRFACFFNGNPIFMQPTP